MTKTYLGVKMVTAWESPGKDGQPGYAVKYSDGYISWSPKSVFETAYFPLAEGGANKISQADVDGFVSGMCVSTIGEKTTIVHATLRNGFEMIEGSSCVDPANYDETLGASFCREKIKDHIWGLLGFVLQWAVKGVKAG